MKPATRKQRLVAEINITPFTDVILVLLVIFMIATPLISQPRIKVDLPEAKAGKTENSLRDHAEITISREGTVYLDGRLVTRKELKRQIYMLHRSYPDLNVTLRSDKFVKFQDIVNILDPLTELGITKVNIAASAEQ
jgi:biopolymer transport protein TolR